MLKLSYLALSLYLLLVGLSAFIANLMVPNLLMATLALIASFGIFLDVCLSIGKRNKEVSLDSNSYSINLQKSSDLVVKSQITDSYKDE